VGPPTTVTFCCLCNTIARCTYIKWRHYRKALPKQLNRFRLNFVLRVYTNTLIVLGGGDFVLVRMCPSVGLLDINWAHGFSKRQNGRMTYRYYYYYYYNICGGGVLETLNSMCYGYRALFLLKRCPPPPPPPFVCQQEWAIIFGARISLPAVGMEGRPARV
jgi:hypothetical protein